MIVTSLHDLFRELGNSKKLSNILCCLLESWDIKVMDIFELKNLFIYPIDQFLDSLITYK